MPSPRRLSGTAEDYLRGGKPTLFALKRFWQISYLPDYITLAICFVATITLKYYVAPFHQVFRLDDEALQYPLAEDEKVTKVWLFFYAAAIPLVLLAIWSLACRPGIHQTHITFLGLLASTVIARLFTKIIKDYIGHPRPDLVARCMPALGTPEHQYVTIDCCTQPNRSFLDDGWRSFPSGHSSFAFSGLGYLTLVLAGQLHAFHRNSSLASNVITVTPLIGAFLVAASRLEDYRHRTIDVSVGALIGLATAYLMYRNYYPSLASECCEIPNPPRFQRAQESGFVKIRDEEEQALQGADGLELGDGREGSDDDAVGGGERTVHVSTTRSGSEM